MLKVRSLSVMHRPGQELHDVNLTVGRGELVALIGPSLSGKSLLLSVIAEQAPPYSGDVIVNHYKAAAEPEKVAQLLGVLLSPFTALEYLTGFEYLELLGNHYHLDHNERTKRIVSLAKEWAIEPYLYVTVESLPANVRQIMGIIAAVLADPPVLVLDSPETHLDPGAESQLIKLLEQKKKDGAAILLATNNLPLAERLADTVAFMNHGEIIAEGTITQLSHLSQSPKDLSAIYGALANRP